MKEAELEKTLKAVANRRRLAILEFLRNKQQSPVNIIAQQIKLSFRSTSKHLSVLYAVDLVEKEQKSISVYYKLNANGRKILAVINSIK